MRQMTTLSHALFSLSFSNTTDGFPDIQRNAIKKKFVKPTTFSHALFSFSFSNTTDGFPDIQ